MQALSEWFHRASGSSGDSEDDVRHSDSPAPSLPSTSPSPSTTESTTAPSYQESGVLPPHIVVLVHGNNGSPTDFDTVEETLHRHFGRTELLVIKSEANFQRTSHGVQTGGERLAEEVMHKVLMYELAPDVDVYKMSFVCHSLGGLYTRYALPQIMSSLSFLRIDYVSFVTLSTPHLGSRRGRGESALRRIYRAGVHTVLASRAIYGQTGVDLLMDPKVEAKAEVKAEAKAEGKSKAEVRAEVKAVEEQLRRAEEEETPLPPVLQTMSELDSEFVRALRSFRHCTLVGMTDGDVVVPYPSASVRNFNPYPSTVFRERFLDWRWHLCHSGFSRADSDAEFFRRLEANVVPSCETQDWLQGTDVESAPRFESADGYECDDRHEVEFPYSMLRNLQQAVAWRRIDLCVQPGGFKGKLRLHDWSINKMQPEDCKAEEWVRVLADMVGSDHGLRVPPMSPPRPFGRSAHSDLEALDVSEGFGWKQGRYRAAHSDGGERLSLQETGGGRRDSSPDSDCRLFG